MVRAGRVVVTAKDVGRLHDEDCCHLLTPYSLRGEWKDGIAPACPCSDDVSVDEVFQAVDHGDDRGPVWGRVGRHLPQDRRLLGRKLDRQMAQPDLLWAV